MITTILKTLNGHGSEAASLEQALLQLSRDRDETRIRIVDLKKQRHAELLDDATDAAIGKIDLLIDRAEVKLEKLNAAEPPLLEKLTGARTAARQRRWRELRETYLSAVGEYLAAAREAIDKHIALAAIVKQAQREGFEGEVKATMPPTPNINTNALLAPDLLDIWERAVTPAGAAPAPRTVKARVSRPAPPKAVESMQHAVKLDLGEPTPIENLTSKRMPDDLSPLEPGEARVIVLHQGWSPRDDRPATHAGQQIKMPFGEARAAANKGLVEIVEMNIDRTKVEGAGWQQGTDPQSLMFLGSGGTAVTQQPDKPASATTEQGDGK
jgi:hypothetical protein